MVRIATGEVFWGIVERALGSEELEHDDLQTEVGAGANSRTDSVSKAFDELGQPSVYARNNFRATHLI